ncbi:hypothetical protein SCHPADRAFT_735773 [Schizopora paradoxa]|uniref:Uncharacterized protein n=1 Tax=Schizopora paradoxa TaxID=27342 RepID=A0A0H2R0A9_9AGAM|nr:hypothetical protein SCHPADRAFT_735773 [Schizopora paradoxa]
MLRDLIACTRGDSGNRQFGFSLRLRETCPTDSESYEYVLHVTASAPAQSLETRGSRSELDEELFLCKGRYTTK